MVTHYEVSEADVRKAIHAFDDIMEPYVEDLRVRKLEQDAAAAAAASEAAVAAAAGQSAHSPLSPAGAFFPFGAVGHWDSHFGTDV